MQNSDCLSKISHELRNPLTLIYSSLQLLETECPAVCDSDLWPQIKQDMLDTIHLLKSMTASFGCPDKAPLAVPEFLSALAESFRPAALTRRIRFDTEISEALSGAVLMADRLRLREAVTNLFVNAMDAAAERSDASPGRISLYAVEEHSDVCIHIRDNGNGIPRERLATLFDAFVTYKSGGIGLGLSISRSIAELHGGSLSVDTCTTQPGTYTDFCLRLPLAGG